MLGMVVGLLGPAAVDGDSALRFFICLGGTTRLGGRLGF
jgi:hypothetical protein